MLHNILILFFSLALSYSSIALHITSTTNLIADLVKTLAGTEIKQDALMGEGVDPHLYRATAQDLVKLRKADIIFYNGLHLEGQLGEILTKLSSKQKVYAVSNYVDPSLIRKEGAAPDPHIWLHPEIWTKVAEGIALELTSALPEKKVQIDSRLHKLKKEIATLAKWGKKEISTIPTKQRLLITSHDAFGYFGQYFDIEVLAVQGLSTESEAGLKDVQVVLDKIKTQKVRSIFIESSVPPAAMERIQESSAAKIGGKLYSDSLGALNTPEGYYVGMLKHNISTIVKGLK